MSVARNFEVSSTSTISFEDAINQGIERVTRSHHGIKGAWIKEQKVDITNGKITSYNVMMIITTVLEDGQNTNQ